MLSKFETVRLNGKIDYDILEAHFIQYIKEKYKIHIILLDYCVNKASQTSIDFWIDTTSKNTMTKWLHKLTKDSFAGPSVNTIGRYSKSTVYFAKRLIKDFFRVYQLSTNINEAYLNIHDFYFEILLGMYGDTIQEIKKSQQILKDYQLSSNNILCDYDPSITILFKNDISYQKFNSRKKEFIMICNSLIKKYDTFNIIDGDINIKLLLESKLDKNILNDYYMRR